MRPSTYAVLPFFRYCAQFSTCRPKTTMLWNSTSSALVPSAFLYVRLVAIAKLHTCAPLGSARSSGSRVRLPNTIALLIYISLLNHKLSGQGFNRFVQLCIRYLGGLLRRGNGLFQCLALQPVGGKDGPARCSGDILAHRFNDKEAQDRLHHPHRLGKSSYAVARHSKLDMPKIAFGVLLTFASSGAFNLIGQGYFFREAFADYLRVTERLAYRLNHRRHALLANGRY